jgi:DNA-binding NarL/FixJ family response regulator
MKTKIAIVEDNRGLRESVVEWLKGAGEMKLVAACPSAEAALRELPPQKPDVVLMDINLPGADGIECVTKLKPLLPETQFLMLTAYEDAQRIFAALEAGASGYLLKRSSRDQLLQAIAEIRQGGSPMSAQIARKVVQSFQKVEPAQDFALSPRETEILKLLAEGLLYKEIADRFGNSVYTINAHIRRIYEKLHVQSRSQAVAKFMKR